MSRISKCNRYEEHFVKKSPVGEIFKMKSEPRIPKVLVEISETLARGLSLEDSREFLYKFRDAAEISFNLSKVWPKFAIWLLKDSEYGVSNYHEYALILKLVGLYEKGVRGEAVSTADRREADSIFLATRCTIASAYVYSDHSGVYSKECENIATHCADAAVKKAAEYYAITHPNDGNAKERCFGAMSEKLLAIILETR